MNLDCLSDHENLEADPRSGFSVSRLRAAVCPACDVVVWWEGAARLAPWEGLVMSLGEAAVITRMPAISAPSEEVFAVRTPREFRASWIPQHHWVEAAPGVYLARSGRYLLLSSEGLDVPTMLSRPRKRHLSLAPVG